MDPTTNLGRLFIKTSSTVHRLLYRFTGGRVGHRVGPHTSTLLLDHVGAKTGHRRTTPLFYVEDGQNLVVVASYHGSPHHPAWYHNLRANPVTEVRVGRRTCKVSARVATDRERERLWGRAVAAYAPYEQFRREASRTGRTVPLVILEPHDDL